MKSFDEPVFVRDVNRRRVVFGGMAKVSKQRPCPAVAHPISPGECGENRMSRYACPESCPFNPFASANYDQMLAIENDVDPKTMAWLAQQPDDRTAYERAMRQPEVTRSGHGIHANTVWQLFFRSGSDGLTCTQRWERAGFPGLKNDGRAMMRAKMQTRVALLEIQRIIDTQTLEVVDLLAPGHHPLRLVDRSLAARSARFSTLLGWAYPTPHFWRMSGTAIKLPDLGQFDAREVVTETVAHLGGPAELDPMRRWLAENFVRFDDCLTATAHERRRRMFAAMDVQWGTVDYELRAPLAECCAALDADPAVSADQPADEERAQGFVEARVCFDDTSDTARGIEPGKARALLGTVLFAPNKARLQASSAGRIGRLRGLFEARLGRRAHFVREQREDLSAHLSRDEPSGDPALVVPKLAESADKLILGSSRIESPPGGGSPEEIESAMRQQHWNTYADTAIPMLDNRTPREASRDLLLRLRLIELMKRNLRQLDEENLRSGRTSDLNWLVRELGLHEIDVPPPPTRPAPPAEDEGDWDDDVAAEPHQPPRDAPISGRFLRRSAQTSDRPPAPMLPPEPLTFDEASDRLENALNGFATAAAAMDELDASGSTLLDDVSAMTEAVLDEDEFSALISFLLMGWFALVPRGSRAPELDFDAMDDAFHQDMEAVPSWLDAGPESLQEAIVGRCRQPIVLELLMAQMFDSTKRMPRKMRLNPAVQLPMTLALKSVINELDRALRGRDRNS